MAPPSEDVVNETLELLREQADLTTTRDLGDGRRVADVVVPSGETLNRFIADLSPYAMGTVSTHIGYLAKVGLVQTGGARGGGSRLGCEEHLSLLLDRS
jgi:hypothetical protein